MNVPKNPETEAWLLGITACEQGQPRNINPYSNSETLINQAEEWFRGWDDAQVILAKAAE